MVWLAVALAAYVAFMFVVARISMRPPRLPIYLSPSVMGAPEEEVVLPSGLRGWWVEAPGAKAAVVLAHGYMMNRSELVPVAYRLWSQGVSSLLLDFAGHGRSPAGRVTFGAEERKAVAEAAAFARARIGGGRVGILGSSMGSAASALAAGDDPKLADLLVLDSCYGRLGRAIPGWWRFLGGWPLMAFLFPLPYITMAFYRFNPFRVDVARALAAADGVPVLFLHGERDDLALPAEATRNYEAAAGPKRIVWFPRQGHSEFRWNQAPAYYEALDAFLTEHGFLVPRPPGP